jgi:hypothetical protein
LRRVGASHIGQTVGRRLSLTRPRGGASPAVAGPLAWTEQVVKDHPALQVPGAEPAAKELLRLIGHIRRRRLALRGSTTVAKRKKIPATLSDQLRARIRRWTEEKECSVSDLAKQAGIDRTVLYRFVTNDRNLNLTTANRLAVVLRLRLADDP